MAVFKRKIDFRSSNNCHDPGQGVRGQVIKLWILMNIAPMVTFEIQLFCSKADFHPQGPINSMASSRATLDTALYSNVRSRPSSMLFNDSGFVRYD